MHLSCFFALLLTAPGGGPCHHLLADWSLHSLRRFLCTGGTGQDRASHRARGPPFSSSCQQDVSLSRVTCCSLGVDCHSNTAVQGAN